MKTDLAKLTVPSIGRVLQRPRLFRLLDRTKKSQLIIWITGPPGSGKTTLAASFISHKKLPCLWCRIDEGDSDLASFFHYLGLAIAKPSKRTASSLPRFLPEFFPHGLSAFTRRFFRQLYNSKGPSCVLVLDNYHDVAMSSPLHKVIREPLNQLRNGDVRRALEWDHPDGLLRFGIPQRVDGQVCMELTVAPKLQTIRDPLWSVQEVQ